MGGNLTLVSSQEGIGSKFSIMLPVLEKIITEGEDNSAEDDESNYS